MHREILFASAQIKPTPIIDDDATQLCAFSNHVTENWDDADPSRPWNAAQELRLDHIDAGEQKARFMRWIETESDVQNAPCAFVKCDLQRPVLAPENQRDLVPAGHVLPERSRGTGQ